MLGRLVVVQRWRELQPLQPEKPTPPHFARLSHCGAAGQAGGWVLGVQGLCGTAARLQDGCCSLVHSAGGLASLGSCRALTAMAALSLAPASRRVWEAQGQP